MADHIVERCDAIVVVAQAQQSSPVVEALVSSAYSLQIWDSLPQKVFATLWQAFATNASTTLFADSLPPLKFRLTRRLLPVSFVELRLVTLLLI
jgi:hypothetical protein